MRKSIKVLLTGIVLFVIVVIVFSNKSEIKISETNSRDIVEEKKFPSEEILNKMNMESIFDGEIKDSDKLENSDIVYV